MAVRHKAVLAKETRKEVHTTQTHDAEKHVNTFIDPTVLLVSRAMAPLPLGCNRFSRNDPG